MPLAPCPDCGFQISPRAAICPRCGYPVAKAARNRRLWKIYGLGIALIGVAWIVADLIGRFSHGSF